MNKKYGLDTLALRAGYTPDATHSVTVPLHMTNAYTFDNVEHARRLFALEESGNIYTRLSNPTNDVLEARITALEGGVGALAFSSGHAAIFGSIVNLASAGDEIVSSSAIYGGAVNLLGVTLGRLGIKTRFVDPGDPANFELASNERTKAFFVETIGNPTGVVADIEGISKVAKRLGIPLIVDSTFTPPSMFRPAEHGADIIIHSSTKFIGGHGNGLGGLVVDTGSFVWKDNPRFPDYNAPDTSYHGAVFADMGAAVFITRLRVCVMRDLGSSPSPFNSFLMLNGLETLSLRVGRHNENAMRVAEFLEGHPVVESVGYCGLPGNKYHALATRQFENGFGSVFPVNLKGGKKAGIAFMDSLELLYNVANLADSRSMVSHPASTTHSQLSSDQLAAAGISPGMIRLSIGLETAEDIIADIARALDTAARV